VNTNWHDERKEIALWLSGYLSIVKKWVDRILNNKDHAVNKNKIILTIDEWVQFLTEIREKIMRMSDKKPTVRPTVNDPGPITKAEVEADTKDNPLNEINKYGDDDWATPPSDEQ
jgi:hypothetical protein